MNLLIVDDETTTRNGLIRHIDWSSFGIKKIELASNGAEALKRCAVFQPDIVLSDIRMPEMDGIELCRKLRIQFPELVILFLSGYSDKEYLHSAIDLGVIDYVEKPIVLEELEAAIKKAAQQALQNRLHNRSVGNMRQMISKNMPIIRQKVMETLLSSADPGEKDISELEMLNIFSDLSWWFSVLIIQYPQPIRNMNDCDSALINHLGNFLAQYEYLLSFRTVQQQILLISSPLPSNLPYFAHSQNLDSLISAHFAEGMPAFCAVGRPAHGIRFAHHSFADAQAALQKLFYQDYGQTAYYTEEPERPLSFDYEILEQFSQSLINPEPSASQDLLNSIFQDLRKQTSVPPSKIRTIYKKIDYLIKERKQKLYPSKFLTEPQPSLSFDSVTLKKLHTFCTEQVNLLFSDRELETRKRIVVQVIQYVQNHYEDSSLSVKEISKAVYLTPNYLSNLFKREMGYSLVEYIREVRIKNSLPLLQDNSLKLYHIALKVGFTDANYYAKMFKKIMGYTPSEYKERHL